MLVGRGDRVCVVDAVGRVLCRREGVLGRGVLCGAGAYAAASI